MFKSKRRPFAITQAEHQRLAGMLAANWGNATFQKPPIRFKSFVKGVAQHDRGYGLFDTLAIGEVPREKWQETTHRGFFTHYEDTAADLIVKLHLRRLVGSNPDHQQLAEEMDVVLAHLPVETGLERALFDQIDRITNLCDMISFDFCFEQPTAGYVDVYANFESKELTQVTYSIEPGGQIRVAPWPFAQDSIEGFIWGYATADLSARSEPSLVEFRCTPAS